MVGVRKMMSRYQLGMQIRRRWCGVGMALVWRWYGAGMAQGRIEIAQLEGFIALDDVEAGGESQEHLLSVAIL